jgi:hypothetical protein
MHPNQLKRFDAKPSQEVEPKPANGVTRREVIQSGRWAALPSLDLAGELVIDLFLRGIGRVAFERLTSADVQDLRKVFEALEEGK